MRGDTGDCSCSHRACERGTHAQRADKKVRKGDRKESRDIQAVRASKRGMGWCRFKRSKSETEILGGSISC